MTTSHSQRISCPNPDFPNPTLIQKVSGVVAGGTTYYAKTTLAQQLSPPDEEGIINSISLGKFRTPVRILLIIIPCIIILPWCLYLYGLLFLGWSGFGFSLVTMAFCLVMAIFAAILYSIQKRIAREIIKALRSKWEQLYYCRSCDSIFFLRKPDFAPADQMVEFLKGNQ